MSQSPLEVKGWVSGLGIFMGPILILVGICGTYSGLAGLIGASDQATAAQIIEHGPYCLLAFLVPIGWKQLKRGIETYREEDPPSVTKP